MTYASIVSVQRRAVRICRPFHTAALIVIGAVIAVRVQNFA